MALGFLSSLLMLFSCQNDELCEEATSNPLRLGFYLPAVTDGGPTPYTVDSLTVYGEGRIDSLIYNNTKNVRSIEVPLNPAEGTTAFVLVFPGNLTDTIWINYNSTLNFVSAECGFTMYHEILGASHTNYRISTIQQSQNQVNNTLEEHIKILLYPDTDL